MNRRLPLLLLGLLASGCVRAPLTGGTQAEQHDALCFTHPFSPPCIAEIDVAAETRNVLQTQPEIRLIYYSPVSSLIAVGPARPIVGPTYRRIAMQDPLGRVMELFATTLRGELGLRDVNATREPLSPWSDTLRQLKQSFGQGIVLDFRTGKWELNANPTFNPFDPGHYILKYAVRVRMIRVEDSTILWRTVCEGITKERHPLDELVANDNSLLKVKAEEVAEKLVMGCVQRLKTAP